MALEAVPGPWGGPPRTERIVFLEVGTDEHAEAEMDARALDVWFPAGVPRRGDHALSVPGLRVGCLAFQTGQEPFARKPLRQAEAAAVGARWLVLTWDRRAVGVQRVRAPGGGPHVSGG